MAASFRYPVTIETREALRRLFGEPFASDERRFLYNDLNPVTGEQMQEIAKTARQPVTVERFADGEIKTLSDGTQYRVTSQGWRKID